MKAIIKLSSELFGVEKFEYSTMKEANEGFSRLMKSCKENFEIDGVDRELTLLNGRDEVSRIKFISAN